MAGVGFQVQIEAPPGATLDGCERALWQALWPAARRLLGKQDADSALRAFVEAEAAEGWAEGSWGLVGERVAFVFRGHAPTSAALARHLLERALAWELPRLDARAAELGWRVAAPRATPEEVLASPQPESFVRLYQEGRERYFQVDRAQDPPAVVADDLSRGDLAQAPGIVSDLARGDCLCFPCFTLQDRLRKAARERARAAKRAKRAQAKDEG
ncbi:MAG: hypothetical protein AB7N76_09955 [Planctomycetota bacterium]